MEVEIKGLKELQRAFNKSPEIVLTKGGELLRRGMAVYQRNIRRSPWRVGESGEGKGAPKSTGYLIQAHQVTQDKFSASLQATAPYALYVHEGTARMTARPWLDSAAKDGQQDINELVDRFLKEVVEELAK